MISLVINVDTRPEKDSQGRMLDGVRSRDFLTDGVINKKNFFRDSVIETIVYVDEHEDHDLQIPGDTVVFSKHREYFGTEHYFPKFNDMNFLQALMLARGEYIVHFDGDMAAFRQPNAPVIKEWLDLLKARVYDYICYPSWWSPVAVTDPTFDYAWASTRFFICRRETLDYTEIVKCLQSDEYLYGKYGDRQRRCPWLEHVLGLIAGQGKVWYPPMDFNRYMIFSWSKYINGTLARLNGGSYEDALAYVKQAGGITYPCDVRAH